MVRGCLWVCASWLLVSCAGDVGAPGRSCSVSEGEDGSKALVCSDGEVRLFSTTPPTQAPVDCTVESLEAARVISCSDGTLVELPTGPQGASGEPGAQGDAGASSLVRTSAVAGEACVGGGVRFEVGVDEDGDGQLADEEVQETSIVCGGEGARDVFVGQSRMCALSRAGALSCWGRGFDFGDVWEGELFDPSVSSVRDLSLPQEDSFRTDPGLPREHMCVVSRSGGLRCAGNGVSDQLGVEGLRFSDTYIKVIEDIASVSVGRDHTCAITTSGQLKCWGRNFRGQVGTGVEGLTQPTPADILPEVAQVSAGSNSTCAVTTSGQLKCWGTDALFDDGQGNFSQPTPKDILSDVVQVALGRTHGCAVTRAGKLMCWGGNLSGQLGEVDGASAQPVEVMSDVVQVAVGHANTCAIKTDGTLWCLGSNASSQFGQPTESLMNREPVEVLSDVVKVSFGQFSVCAIKTSGALLCWGSNIAGQLGGGDGLVLETPTRIPL